MGAGSCSGIGMADGKTKRPRKAPRARGREAGPARAKRVYGPVEVFFAQALAIEREAAARYREFAHQMTGYGNARTAELFLRLARFESEHAEQLLEKTAGMKLPSVEQIRRGLVEGSMSEVATYEFLYRRVLPHHALLMALAAERRAKAYFERTRKATRDPGIRKLAAAFAREEGEHIVWIEQALEAEPQTVHRFDELAD
jgi:rubrerythrin